MIPEVIDHLYPNCNFVARDVRIGGMGKPAILEEMECRGIKLNEAGKLLFTHPGFTTAESISTVSTVEITVANLGFKQGADFSDLLKKAVTMGLGACPLELGPHLRLQFPDQQEGQIEGSFAQHRAPSGSITVVSPRIDEDMGAPQGFYLRRMGGVPWLRGYWSGPEHIWSPDDHLVFAVTSK